jgi:hypothetical protein
VANYNFEITGQLLLLLLMTNSFISLRVESGNNSGYNTFDAEARNAVLDLTMDDDTGLNSQTNAKKWDRKRKRFVGDSGNVSISG